MALGLGGCTPVQFTQAAADAAPGPSPVNAAATTSGAAAIRRPCPASHHRYITHSLLWPSR